MYIFSMCPALANCQLSWHVGSLLTFSLMWIPHKHDKHKYPFGQLHRLTKKIWLKYCQVRNRNRNQVFPPSILMPGTYFNWFVPHKEPQEWHQRQLITCHDEGADARVAANWKTHAKKNKSMAMQTAHKPRHKHKRKYKGKQSKRILDICSTGLMSDDDAPFIINLKWFRAVGARPAVRTLLVEVTTQRLNARLHHRTRRTACIRIARTRICVSVYLRIRVSLYPCIRVSASVCTRVSSIGKSCAAYGSVFL